MATKGDLARDMYTELQISGITVQPGPKDLIFAIYRMDRLVNSYKNSGLCLGYADSSLVTDPSTQESGLSANDELAVILNLAKTVAPAYGKMASPDTKSQAKLAYEGLFSPNIAQREATPYQPTGAGSRSRYNYGGTPYCRYSFQDYQKNVPDNCTTLDIKVGQTKIYTIDLSGQISEGSTLASYEYTTLGGVGVVSITETDAVFTVEMNANQSIYSTLTIMLTMTPSNEVNPVTTYFNVTET